MTTSPSSNYSFEWTEILNKSIEFSFFELQFANCKRLEKNNDIYIFDEVGTGKTISAGLMAIHYIYNKYKWKKKEQFGHKIDSDDEQPIIRGKKVDTDVLIITANAVKEQFLNDWKEKLNFKYDETVFCDYDPLKNRVRAINYESVNISKEKNKKIGLLIVDEAHKFIIDDANTKTDEDNSQRYNELKELNAEKVIFLTATPNRYDKSNLDKYVELAAEILNKNGKVIVDVDKRKDDIRSCFGKKIKDESDLICCKLDYNLCATRYFKDTVRRIQNSSFEKIKAKRWIPEIWENPLKENQLNKINYNNNTNSFQKFEPKMHDITSDYYNKYNNNINKSIFYVIYKICEIRDENNNSKQLLKDRFLIFIDRIYEGQNVIKNHFEYISDRLSSDFFNIKICEYDKSKVNKNNILTYKIVNSYTEEQAQDYGKGEDVPDILVVISQAVEQGVNLPSYSYIINFDVNKSIAALEQRFGRIDRINDTRYTDIHTVYVLDYRERNKYNFIQAIYNYKESLEKEYTIPSKNVVINDKTLDYFMTSNNIESLLKEQEDIIENNKNDFIYNNKKPEDLQNISLNNYNYLFDLNEKFEKLIVNGCNDSEHRKQEINEILKEINKIHDEQEKLKKIKDSFFSNGDRDILDSIFYSKEHELASIKGTECAKYILEKGAEQMEELSALNPARKFFDNNKDLILKIEKEIEYIFLLKSYGKDKNGKENDMVFSWDDEVNIDGEIIFPTIRIVNLAIKEYSENQQNHQLEKITKYLIYKNYEQLPFFQCIKSLEDIVKECIEKGNYDLSDIQNVFIEKIKNIESVSDEFKDIVELEAANNLFDFEIKESNVLCSKPFLKMLFYVLFKGKINYDYLKETIKYIDSEKIVYNYYSSISNDSYYWSIDANSRDKIFKNDLNKEYICNEEFNKDVDIIKKLLNNISINELLNDKSINEHLKFNDWEAKILYFYLKNSPDKLKEAFSFHDLNMILPFAKYEAQDRTNYGTVTGEKTLNT